MRKEFKPFESWIGEWAGKGDSVKGIDTIVRLCIRPRLGGEALEFTVEALNADTSKLVHGVVSLLSVDPDGAMRMAVYSTIHGSLVMPVTPEDPGALAIEGISVQGNRVIVSLVEDGENLMLTSYWKPKDHADATPAGFSNSRLSRITRET